MNIFKVTFATPASVAPEHGARLTQSTIKAQPMSGTIVTHIWDFQKFHQFFALRFPNSSEAHMATITGIPVSTIKKHLRGESSPGADHMLKYVLGFGAEFLAEMLPDCPQSLEDAAHAERLEKLRQRRQIIETELAQAG